jgi:hypothetical protein
MIVDGENEKKPARLIFFIVGSLELRQPFTSCINLIQAAINNSQEVSFLESKVIVRVLQKGHDTVLMICVLYSKERCLIDIR